jgi:hypothetical protein
MIPGLEIFLQRPAAALWDWAVRLKHWPCLIPIPAATLGYLYLQTFARKIQLGNSADDLVTTALSAEEIWFHWGFKVVCGAALIVSGPLWWGLLRGSLTVSRNVPLPPQPNALALLEKWFHYIFPRKTWFRLSVGALISITGVGFVTTGVRGRQEMRRVEADIIAEKNRIIAQNDADKEPPLGKLAIAVVSFIPTSATSTEEETNAKNISRWLTLELARDTGAPLVVTEYPDNPFVKGAREHTREHEEARKFGRKHGLHLVIWGQVGTCDAGARVSPEFSAAYDWKGEVEIAEAVAYYKPDLESFYDQCTRTNELERETRDIARLILGVAYYRAKKWETAIDHFRQATSEEARLWTALCYHEQAREPDSDDSAQEKWRRVTNAYEAVIQLLTGNNTQKDNWLSAVAHLKLGDANQDLPAHSKNERKQNLMKAVHEYGQSIEAYRRIIPDGQAFGAQEEGTPPWVLQNNLGAAWFTLAHLEVSDQIARLKKAKEAFDAGFELLEHEVTNKSLNAREVQEGRALLYSNRASALAEWGRLLEERNQPGRSKLEDAKKDLENPLAVSSNNVRQAKTQTNRANVLTQLGKLTPGLEGDNLIREAIEIYGVVLTTFEAGSVEYLFAQKARAEAHYDEGVRSGNAGSFEHARVDYNQTIPALQAHGPREQFIDAREYLVRTLEQLVRIYDSPDSDGRSRLISTRQELSDARRRLQQAQLNP